MPNPDAVIYLRAAEYFSADQWNQGFSVYRWPLYSLFIASLMPLTGGDALLASHVVNALLTVGTTTAFIALASRLTNGDKAFVTVATIMIVFHPQLMELRPWVIRDHGYFCFFLVAVYCAVADNQKPSLRLKLALAVSLALATLFRIEGLFLTLLVALYYVLVRLRSVTQQASVIGIFIVATAAALPFIFGVWSSGTFKNWMSGNIVPAHNPLFAPEILRRVETLKKEVLTHGSGHGWQAYISIVIGLTLSQIVRAFTPVYSVLAFFAFLPHRLLPRQAVLPVIWFSAGQLPMFFLFTFIMALLDWRYPMAFALVLMFAAVAVVTASWRELLMARTRAFFVFPTMISALAIAWALDIPRNDRFAYFGEAANWIKENVPAEANVWMNDPRIAYFAGRDYGTTAGVAEIFFLPPPGFETRGEIDVFVVSSHDLTSGRLGFPDLPSQPQLVRTFKGRDNDSIQVLATCPEMKDCKFRPQ